MNESVVPILIGVAAVAVVAAVIFFVVTRRRTPGTPGIAAPPPARGMAALRSRLSTSWTTALTRVLGRSHLSASDWEELEEILLGADLGVDATDEVLTSLRAAMVERRDDDPTDVLRDVLLAAVDPTVDRTPGWVNAPSQPATVIVVGVNGVGKTTSVGKIGRLAVAQGSSVVMGAADTFRAAAADQLQTWGERIGADVIRDEREGADPASVAFRAVQHALDTGADIALIDTAGRLHNKRDLMDELGKVVRVVSKVAQPCEILLVIDATTGQNGLTQARVFAEAVPVSGIVLTKLDGSARGGIVVAVQREVGVPVKFVGLGEGADDLAAFEPTAFVDGLLGR